MRNSREIEIYEVVVIDKHDRALDTFFVEADGKHDAEEFVMELLEVDRRDWPRDEFRYKVLSNTVQEQAFVQVPDPLRMKPVKAAIQLPSEMPRETNLSTTGQQRTAHVIKMADRALEAAIATEGAALTPSIISK